MMIDKTNFFLFAGRAMQFLRWGAMLGFFVTAVLVINLNNKAFRFVFREHARSYFWFFLILSIIPLLVFIYLFNAFFGKLNLSFAASQ
jgi:hypothetical protein